MDFEGEYTMRTAPTNRVVNPDAVYPDCRAEYSPRFGFRVSAETEMGKDSSDVESDSRFPAKAGMETQTEKRTDRIHTDGIPLPLIYVKEDEKGVYVIVDGKQRLSTLFSFINKNLLWRNSPS